MTESREPAQHPALKRLAERPLLFALVFGWVLAMLWNMHTGLVTGSWPDRIAMILQMLTLAHMGNLFPKMILREQRDRLLRRLSGWAYLVGGLVSAALLAVAPMPLATEVSLTILIAVSIFTIGYRFLMRWQSDSAAVWAFVLTSLSSAALFIIATRDVAILVSVMIFGGTAASVAGYFLTKHTATHRNGGTATP